GTSPYTCQWNIPSNNCTPSVLAGTYCVTITDYNSCTVANCGTVNQPAQVTIVETIVNASCGQSDGSISVSVSGGAVPYTYQWNTGGSTNSLVDIPTGTYVLTVKDAKNCSVTEAYIVNNISGPVLQIDSVHHILCYGDNTGEAFASATGGQGTLTYSWSDLLGQNAPVATNLLAGTYYVTVKDTNQCADIDSVIILQPAQALGFFLNTDEPQCFGESNGSATVIPYGGTPPYNFLWSGGCTPSGNQCLNLNAGFYSIQVTDTNGCVLVQNFTLGQPTQIILLVDHTDASCSGTGDGTAFVDTVYGGTPDPVLGYTYLWSDNQMTNPALNLDPGLYCVTVFDDYYCTQSACVTVGSPSTLTFQNININNVDCYGNSTGSVTVIATGGSPGQSGYNYYWEDNAGNFIGNSPSLSNLSQGVYYLTISDLNSCSINTTIIINQPPPLLVNVPDDSVSCFSDCDGSLIAEVIGGQSPYYIIWSTLVSDTLIPYAPGVPINDTIINLCAGQYSVTVIDDADCSVSDNTLLYEPPLLQVANVVTTDATCGYNDGCAEIIFNGGTVGFIFMWSDSIGNSAYECGLAAGNYSVTVMDNNGCTTYTNVDVNNLNGPQIVLPVPVTDISCYGLSDGSAYVLFNESNPPAGPYDIYWYNNESIQIGQGASVNGMSEGTYSVNVIDTNNCLAVATFQVDQPNTLQSLITSVPATCFDFCNGSAYVISVGGTMPYYYLWSNGGTNIQATGLCAGYVDVIVTDDNGCTSQSATVIGQPQQLNMLVTVHDVTCYGFHNGSISIIPSGGSGAYNYQWCNGGTSNMAGQLSAGTCCMILYDQTNPQCNIDSCFTLTQPDLIVPYVTTTETTCNSCNGTATITDIEGGSGLFNATWSPPNTVPTATGLCYGTSYLLLVTDQLDNNCSVTQFVAVGRIPPPVVLSVEYDNPSCYGLPDGNALVRVKDGTPVYYYEWALITQGIPNIIVAGPNDSIAMNIPGGYYNVTITDADGCTTFTSFTLTQPNPINVFGHGTGYICHGQTTVISATASGGTPPYDYFWTNNITTQSQIVSPAISTMYMVTVVDVNGCQSQTPAVVSISVRPQLQTTIFAVDTSVCEGQSVNMLANTIYSYGQVYYLWSNGGTDSTITVSPLENTTFYLTVYDECGMPATDDKGVTVHPAPIIDVIADILEGCQPLLVNFSNAVEQDFITYLWNFGDATSGSAHSSYLQSPSHTYLQPGTYNVTLQVTDQQYNCTNEFVYENLIAVYAIPEASFIPSPNPTSLFNAEIQFINQTVGGSIWIWDFGDASYSFEQHPVHTYESADTFIVMLDARTPQGCRDTALVNVYINPEFTFYAPTAFTPKHEQGLGENDYFTPKGNGIADCDGCYHLYIYDRWGELIFETDEFYGNNPADKNRWNGKVKNKGRPVEVGVYK
ncbi:MAG: PKD domain-containing protein, partial [Bacteroidia bacterium]|nr:PKD domain-containing protein [Bacteroidia bacterium]